MADVGIRLAEGELNAQLAGAPSPTADDVSITADGIPLDSAEAVLAFISSLSGNGSAPG